MKAASNKAQRGVTVNETVTKINNRITIPRYMKPACIIFLIVVANSSVAAENGGNLWWPQFRGPNCSGLGAGKPPVHFGPSQNVQWKTSVGPGISSPVIWAERVFL